MRSEVRIVRETDNRICVWFVWACDGCGGWGGHAPCWDDTPIGWGGSGSKDYCPKCLQLRGLLETRSKDDGKDS